jgi:hypothetical protein
VVRGKLFKESLFPHNLTAVMSTSQFLSSF